MRGWDGVFAAAFAAGFAMPCGCFGATAQEQPRPASVCSGETIAQGSASRTIDGRSFVLDDGREVRLAAIEVPPLPLPQESDPAPGGAASRDALDALLLGALVTLKQAESRRRTDTAAWLLMLLSATATWSISCSRIWWVPAMRASRRGLGTWLAPRNF
jgi:hypothetical protein